MSSRTRPRIIAAVIVPFAMLVALFAWGVSSPPGSSPDDDYHMASIWCAAGPADGRCEETDSPEYRRLPADLVAAARCFAWDPDQSASCELDVGELQATKRGNWVDESYPPVFYAVMQAFVGDDVSTSVVVMRLVNALLYVGILSALFFLLPPPQRRVLVWGAAITAVPLGVFLIASVNPSAWAVLSATGLWIAIWGYFQQVGARRWLLAALAVVLLVMGAGARSDSAVYGVLALIVGVTVAFRWNRRFALDALFPLALSVVAVFFFFSGGQSAIVSTDTASQNQQFGLSTLAFIDAKLLPQLWAGVFGTWGLGWLDTHLPGIVWVTTISAFAAAVFWGLNVGGTRKWIALAGVAASLIVVPMYILLHDGVVVGSYVQPRYIYPLIIMFGGVAVVGFARAGLGLRGLQLIVLGLGLTTANSVALHVNLRRYITGVDFPGFNLDASIEWWWGGPVSPMMVWALGSAAFAVTSAALVWLVWERRPERAIGSEEPAQPSRSLAD